MIFDRIELERAADIWRREGWILIPSLIPQQEIDAALDDLWLTYPRPGEFHRNGSDPRKDDFFRRQDPDLVFPVAAPEGAAFRPEQLLGVRQFPLPGSGKLNRLLLHPNLLSFARAALGDDDILLYLAETWAKYTGVANYEQPMHQDPNHSLLPSRPGWWNLQGFIYLSDVDETSAPTRLVPHSAVPAGKSWPNPAMPQDAPELYAAEVSAPGPRGSYLAYRSDVWHRSVDLTRPGGARFLMAAGYKVAGHEWVGFDAIPRKAPNHFFKCLVASCAPSELAVLGFPRPGHPIWNDDIIARLAVLYPGLDVAPWREALTSGTHRE